MFEISQSAKVTIGYLTIANGLSVGADGGGILVGAGSVVYLNEIVMTGNHAMADSSGRVGGSGGGIENEGTLSVSNCTFTSNVASLCSTAVGSQGGGIASQGGTLTVTSSYFVGNQAVGGNSATSVGGPVAGGGIASTGFSTTSLINVIFQGNQAKGGTGGPGSVGGSSSGGGFYNGTDSTASVSTCLFLGNRASGGAGGRGATGGVGEGGAIANAGGFGDLLVGSSNLGADNSSLTLDRSALIFNVVERRHRRGCGGNGLGGGFFADTLTTATISWSWVGANQATGGEGGLGGTAGAGLGGGIDVSARANVWLENTRLAGNHATSSNNDLLRMFSYL